MENETLRLLSLNGSTVLRELILRKSKSEFSCTGGVMSISRAQGMNRDGVVAAASGNLVCAFASAQETPLPNPVLNPGAPWAYWGFIVNAPETGDLFSQFKTAWASAVGKKLPEPDRTFAFTVAAEAIKWFKLAADQRDNGAQLNLAVFYGRGDGVPSDPAEAEKWERMAANNGNERARQVLRGR